MAKRTSGYHDRPKPNPEVEAYKKYLKDKSGHGSGAKIIGERTHPDDKKWEQWRKDRSEGLSDYVAYRQDQSGKGVRMRDEAYENRKSKWEQFEKDKFGGALEGGKGTGESGKYTLDDLYIKISDKEFKDKQRELLIDPYKKKKTQGSVKGGSRKTGGKTSGPGNPNTGAGGGAGDANL